MSFCIRKVRLVTLGAGLCMFVFGLVQLNRYLTETYTLALILSPMASSSSSSMEDVVTGYNNTYTELSDDDVTKTNLPRLRFDWGNLEVTTPLGKRMEAFQSNCSIPMGKLIYRNKFGLGSDLHIWGTVICNAMDIGRRVVTHKPWIYEDQGACRDFHDNPSSMACYFRRAEMRCPEDQVMATHTSTNATKLYLQGGSVGLGCPSIQKIYSPADIRAAATEFLFAGISPIVVREARRQLLKVFGPQGPPQIQLRAF